MGKEFTQNLKEIDLLFETSWEVCNKVGGIFTVLSTKARCLSSQFGKRLIFIGPDLWTEENPSPWFKERKTILRQAADNMKLPYGIRIRTGRWNIPGNPIAILVKFDGVYPELPGIFGKMWEMYGVDSIHAYGDYDEGCAFGVAAAIVIRTLSAYLRADSRKTIAHFDEWTTGMGLLYLKSIMPGASTIFTTHATSIGRSICGNGKPLYKYFDAYDGDQMARELNMEAKHSVEKTAAMQADCFTTVSDVTALECQQLLGVRPDIVTPNGFEPDFIPSSEKYRAQRMAGREKLLRIVESLSGRKPSDDALIVATAGRNEYRNKGLDLFIDSMAALSRRNMSREVYAFILVPAWTKEPSGALLIDLNQKGHDPVVPSFTTHRLNNEDSDSVFCRLRSLEDQNALGGEKQVKVVYLPCYLDGADGILNIPYYDVLPAIDLTVFPSYYEPWGYTPLESIAFGVPTITTDKAGFGMWTVKEGFNSLTESGVEVLARDDDNYLRSAEKIADAVESFASLPEKQVERARDKTRLTSSKADWREFIGFYYEAFNIAMRNHGNKENRK